MVRTQLLINPTTMRASTTKKTTADSRWQWSSAVFTLLLLRFACDRCAAYSGVIPPDPENPGKCLYRGDELKLGENPGNGPCQRLTCQEDGSIRIDGCGKVRIEKCNHGERLNVDKPYPACCVLKYKCRNADGSSFYIEKNLVDDNSTS